MIRGHKYEANSIYLIGFNINFMKKIRLQKPSSQHSALPHKRNSLHEAYNSKCESRAHSPRDIENQGRSFFQSMKSELCTIKQDFEKLIRKEITLKPQTPLTLSNTNKSKYCSSARKDIRSVSEYDTLQLGAGHKEREESYRSILNLQKNLPCSSAENKAFITSKPSQNKIKTSMFSEIDLGGAIQKKEEKVNQNEIEMKSKIDKLEGQLQKMRNESQKQMKEMNQLSREKDQIKSELTFTKEQLSSKKEQINSLTLQNNELRQTLKHLQIQHTQNNTNNQQYLNQINRLNYHLSQLSFQHDQLRNIHQQVLDQNHQLKINLSNIEQYCDETHKRWEGIQNEYRRKIDYMIKDMEEYKKREDMFTRQIQRLQNHKTQVAYVPSTAGQDNSELIEEINFLKTEVEHLQRQVNLEKQLHSNLSQKYEEKVNTGNDITDMVVKLQKRLEELVEENGKLKTKVNFAESSVESIKEQNRSYIEQIQLYEERDRKQSVRRQLTPTQWEQMTEQIEHLKEQNKRLSEQIQFRSCEKQNASEKYQSPLNEELLKLTHSQIQQIDTLKYQIKDLIQHNTSLQKEIQSYQALQMHGVSNELEKKKAQVNSLKEIIFKVIVEKAGKLEDEQEVDHIMRELDLLRTQIV